MYRKLQMKKNNLERTTHHIKKILLVNRVHFGYVCPEIKVSSRTTKSLCPHKLGKIVWYHISVRRSMHSFEFRFTSLPHCFDAVSANPRHWVNEVVAVVNGTVLVAKIPRFVLATHISDQISVFGLIQCCMMGRSVAASRRGTGIRKPCHVC